MLVGSRGCRGVRGPNKIKGIINISKLINSVIHKVRTLRAERGGPAKSVLARMGERRRVICKRTYPIIFFIDS